MPKRKKPSPEQGLLGAKWDIERKGFFGFGYAPKGEEMRKTCLVYPTAEEGIRSAREQKLHL